MAGRIPFPYRELHPQIDTPALLIWQPQLDRNIEAMQALASAARIRLRPHVKTHKSTDIAQKQIMAGAAGLTVAKLAEAEVMAHAGFKDIFIANQVAHPLKFHRLQELYRTTRVILGIDHRNQIELLEPYFRDTSGKLEVRIEIDSGLNRCGVEPGTALIDLASFISQLSWLTLEGIFTHAGQVYGAVSTGQIREIAHHEIQVMEEAVSQLTHHGIAFGTVSVGSTPAAPWYGESRIVNEMRPGNYIFNDGIQCTLGVCTISDCSLYVLATVISVPAPTRIVIDAGSKALALDKGAQSTVLLNTFGTPLNIEGSISRLSEEHGIIETRNAAGVRIGDPVVILPNHACAVTNLFEYYHIIDADFRVRTIPVSAGTKSQ